MPRARRGALMPVAVALAVAGLIAACSSGRPAKPAVSKAPASSGAGPSAAPNAAAAGDTWVSGTYGNYPADVNAWGAWRGRETGVATIFTDRSSWSSMVTPEWPLNAFTRSKFAGQISIGEALFPKSGNLAACASGDYDHYWKLFGTTLIRYGRADADVRLGWEFNGNWFWWSATNVAQWKSCFQRSVTAIRSTDPKVIIDWNLSAHRDHLPSGGPGVWAAYPGDAYVDVIGIDAYDSYPASVTDKLWNRQCTSSSGLCTVIAFARAHHKKFSVPEWGVVRTAGGGGDNPFYIKKMYQTFQANADILSFEAYFSIAEKGNVDSALHNPDLNPSSASEYQRLFGSG
jgi:Glycosyl hydrolase family 26